MVLAVAPPEDLEHGLGDLDLDRVLEVLGRDVVLGDEHVAEPLERGLLRLQGLVEPVLAELALLDEHVAEAVLEALRGLVGHHHHAVLERDGDVVLLVVEGQDAGLPLQPDELEYVGEPEILDRPFEGHRRRLPHAARPGRAGGGLRRAGSVMSISGRPRFAIT